MSFDLVFSFFSSLLSILDFSQGLTINIDVEDDLAAREVVCKNSSEVLIGGDKGLSFIF